MRPHALCVLCVCGAAAPSATETQAVGHSVSNQTESRKVVAAPSQILYKVFLYVWVPKLRTVKYFFSIPMFLYFLALFFGLFLNFYTLKNVWALIPWKVLYLASPNFVGWKTNMFSVWLNWNTEGICFMYIFICIYIFCIHMVSIIIFSSNTIFH